MHPRFGRMHRSLAVLFGSCAGEAGPSMWGRPDQGHSLDHLFSCDASQVELGVGGGTVKCRHTSCLEIEHGRGPLYRVRL